MAREVEALTLKMTKLIEEVFMANLHKEGARQQKLLMVSMVRNVIGPQIASRLLDGFKEGPENIVEEQVEGGRGYISIARREESIPSTSERKTKEHVQVKLVKNQRKECPV